MPSRSTDRPACKGQHDIDRHTFTAGAHHGVQLEGKAAFGSLRMRPAALQPVHNNAVDGNLCSASKYPPGSNPHIAGAAAPACNVGASAVCNCTIVLQVGGIVPFVPRRGTGPLDHYAGSAAGGSEEGRLMLIFTGIDLYMSEQSRSAVFNILMQFYPEIRMRALGNLEVYSYHVYTDSGCVISSRTQRAACSGKTQLHEQT